MELRRLWRIHHGFQGTGAHQATAAEYEASGRADLAKVERERVHDTLLDVLQHGRPRGTPLGAELHIGKARQGEAAGVQRRRTP